MVNHWLRIPPIAPQRKPSMSPIWFQVITPGFGEVASIGNRLVNNSKEGKVKARVEELVGSALVDVYVVLFKHALVSHGLRTDVLNKGVGSTHS